MDTSIVSIRSRRVWDSRGRPTIEAEVGLACGASGRAIAPAGASRGSHEAIDLRDGGAALGGYDVGKARSAVSGEIARALQGMDATAQAAVDAALIALDGTANKARLGGNTTVAVSMAVLHAAAAAHGVPLYAWLADGRPLRLPLPEVQIFGGGAHAGRRIDIQDLMVMAPRAQSFDEAMFITAEVYRAAGMLMAEQGRLSGVADEGGWWPQFASNEEALQTLVASIERAGYIPGDDVVLSLDIAASELYADGYYTLGLEKKRLDADAMSQMLLGWIADYPIASIEDPLAEHDTAGLARFTRAAGEKIQIIGDDFLVTSAARVRAAAAAGACNAVLLKPNQAGTITETRAALDAARAAGWATIVSARSGETEDTTIVHLATGWDAGQLKVGSFARSERMAKWNEALRIEEALGSATRFAGGAALAGARYKASPKSG
jgi:enolase